MFNKTDITTTVKQYIARESFYQSNTVQEDTLIFENGLLDSMGFLFFN